MSSRKIAIVAGTRPEAIKLAPVYWSLKQRGLDVDYIKTGQHDELHDQVTSFFKIEHSVSMQISMRNRNLSILCAELFSALEKIMSEKDYEAVIVQGDTASALCAAQVAFLNKIKIYHVEAGLRSHDLTEPFPEEAFRKIISVIADKHFCPTIGAYNNLIDENIAKEKIIVTGNTVVDSIRTAKVKEISSQYLKNEIGEKAFSDLDANPFFLLTVHRRENHGNRLEEICEMVKSFCKKSKTKIICPLHPNPVVKQRIIKELATLENIHLVNALSYPAMIWVLENCKFIVSDSGGIQEEAPSFGKKILILREQTERPEVIDSGWGELIGTKYENTILSVRNLDQKITTESDIFPSPFGDGFASEKICEVIMKDLKFKN